MGELISIIVPVYNVKQYLERCVKSILNQTYKNIEIILVDDGSTDGSEIMCDEYKKNYSNIKVIHKKNGGLSDARNYGIELAQGEYITFIDSDDFIDNRMIEILYKNLKNTNSDVSVCRFYMFYAEEDIKVQDVKEKVLIFDGIDILKTMYDDYLVTVVAWNKLYKKEIFNNIRYPKGKVIEDSAVLHYILANINRICYSNLELYYYFQRNESIMHKTTYKLLDELDWLNDRIEYFKSLNFQNEIFFEETIRKYIEAFFNWTYKITKDNGYNERKMKPYFEQCSNILKNNNTNNIETKKIKMLLKYKFIYLYVKGLRNLYRKIKYKLLLIFIEKRLTKRYKKFIKIIGNSEKCLIFNAPNHGNIGDHAILLAEEEFLKSKGYKVFPVVSDEIDIFIEKFSSTINMKDFVFITGGGNLGTLWEHEQINVNKVLEKYKNNKIIIFPQTVYYSNDIHGVYRLELDKKIYKECKNLKFTCRDSKSFEFVKNIIELNTIQTSDIATYLNYSEINSSNNGKRQNILICLRNDKEKVSSNFDIQKIIQYSRINFPNEKIYYIDTVFKGRFSLKKGKRYLNKFLKRVKSSKLFITDRLHGMIFAVITGTPCIAMNNSSGKVKGVYKWISEHNNFVRFIENYNDFENQIKELDLSKNYVYNNKKIKINFDKIMS